MRHETGHEYNLDDRVSQLQSVMDTTGFELVFQPKFRATNGSIRGVEVLVRWPNADQAWQQPDQFVRLAEEQALSTALDLQVLTQTLRTLNSMPAGVRLSLSPISINISAASVQDDGFLDAIKRILSSTHHPKLIFELTETAPLGSLERACNVFNSLTRYGVSLSIDDFLQGHNDYSVLQALPATEIKIDRKDVAMIHERRGFQRVAGIITIAKQRDLLVTAEGIENEGQWSLLKSMGCDFCQGFWLAPPMDMTNLIRFSHDHQNKNAQEFELRSRAFTGAFLGARNRKLKLAPR